VTSPSWKKRSTLSSTRWRNHSKPPVTATSRAYRALVQLHVPVAVQEAEAIERVRQRLASHLTPPVTQTPHTEEEPELLLAPEPPYTLPEYLARQVWPRSRMRAVVNGAAALLLVSALLGAFFALLHPGGLTPAFSAYQWRIVPSANTSPARTRLWR
jgi:hypothetical protein